MGDLDSQKQKAARTTRSQKPLFGAAAKQPFFARTGGVQRKPFFGAGPEHSFFSQGHAVQREPFFKGPTVQAKLAVGDKSEQATVQRMEEDDELQMKSMAETVQRQGALEDEELVQGKFAPTQRQRTGAAGENRTGMPDQLRSGLEQLSGMDMSGVRVHRNSARPANLQAHAYAQGQDIHLAPGQDRHLPHEAWHVVQQMQGRVRPTMQVEGAAVNDDVGLEREADQMGARAAMG